MISFGSSIKSHYSIFLMVRAPMGSMEYRPAFTCHLSKPCIFFDRARLEYYRSDGYECSGVAFWIWSRQYTIYLYDLFLGVSWNDRSLKLPNSHMMWSIIDEHSIKSLESRLLHILDIILDKKRRLASIRKKQKSLSVSERFTTMPIFFHESMDENDIGTRSTFWIHKIYVEYRDGSN
jgi:hypothetical protein